MDSPVTQPPPTMPKAPEETEQGKGKKPKGRKRPRGPARAPERGKRYRLFPRGDVFLVEMGERGMDLLYHTTQNDEGETVETDTLQFFNSAEAVAWLRNNGHRLVGRKIAVVTINRLFDPETVTQPRIMLNERPRKLKTAPKGEDDGD